MSSPRSVVMIGATGAVGAHAARRLAGAPTVTRLSLLGRRPADAVTGDSVEQHVIDVANVESYRALLAGHDSAVCTLGVGEPSKISKAAFRRIDHDVVLRFGEACRAQGIAHFVLLSSVGADAGSRSYYLRTKGELIEALQTLGFARLSVFQPSMIMTPTNRYGASQAVMLALMPIIDHILVGSWRQYRSVKVDALGRAIANEVLNDGSGFNTFSHDDFANA